MTIKKWVIKMLNRKKIGERERSIIRHWKKKLRGSKLYRRIEVLDYAGKGYTNREISKLTDYSESRVGDLISEFVNNGIGFFLIENRGGNRRNLTDEQEKAIIDKFKEQAEEGKVVCLREMKKAYDAECNRETANSTFYDFLERVGWRKVKPRGAHPKKASDVEIDATKKLTKQ